MSSPDHASQQYAIGRPGIPWGDREKSTWLSRQQKQRSYAALVEQRITALADRFDVQCYAELKHPAGDYKVYAVASRSWDTKLPNVLITGGVHGYETSGVLGALHFLETQCERYTRTFNFLVLPCISPWAFETVNRWNALAIDPNRSFVTDSPAPEAAAVVKHLRDNYLHDNHLKHKDLQSRPLAFLAHFDLHETTDTDNSEFRPALEARDAKAQPHSDIPDGFYGVADTSRPAPEFQKAIIESVAKVTHIAPPIDGKIIGETLQQPGVICYDGIGLGLCMGVTDAPYVTTTEVYPDSPRVTEDECVAAQVAAIIGGLEYLGAQVDKG